MLAKGGRIFNPKLESGYELKVSYYYFAGKEWKQ